MNKPFEFNQGKPISTEAAGVTVTKVGVHLGAEVRGVDLRRPLSNEQFKALEDALVEHELIIFRNQDITSENLIEFGRRFGELTVHPFAPSEEKAPELIKFRNDERMQATGRDVPQRKRLGAS
jgi:alpha-ketoglutarate-dependent taurine dioxygenase